MVEILLGAAAGLIIVAAVIVVAVVWAIFGDGPRH